MISKIILFLAAVGIACIVATVAGFIGWEKTGYLLTFIAIEIGIYTLGYVNGRDSFQDDD